MEYVRFAAQTIFFLIIFQSLFNFALKLAMLPVGLFFNGYLIHLLNAYGAYVNASYFVFIIKSFSQAYDISSVVCIIIACIICFCSYLFSYNKEMTHVQTNMLSLIMILTPISIPFIYFFDLHYFAYPALWCLKLGHFILKIPVIGHILNFILNASVGLLIIWVLFIVIIAVLKLFSIILKLRCKRRSRK